MGVGEVGTHVGVRRVELSSVIDRIASAGDGEGDQPGVRVSEGVKHLVRPVRSKKAAAERANDARLLPGAVALYHCEQAVLRGQGGGYPARAPPEREHAPV